MVMVILFVVGERGEMEQAHEERKGEKAFHS